MGAVENMPVRRTWHRADGTIIEQRLESYELRVVIDGGLTKPQAETRIRGMIQRRVLDNGGEMPLDIELRPEMSILMITPDGESEVQMITATAYYFPEVVL